MVVAPRDGDERDLPVAAVADDVTDDVEADHRGEQVADDAEGGVAEEVGTDASGDDER